MTLGARCDVRAFEPSQSVAPYRTQGVIEELHDIRAVREYEPDVLAIMPVPANESLKTLAMEAQP